VGTCRLRRAVSSGGWESRHQLHAMKHDFAYGVRQEFLRPRMSWEMKLALVFFAIAIITALSTEAFGGDDHVKQVRAPGLVKVRALSATTQSPTPWTIQQCDKLMGRQALAVFNVSLWNQGGWPLWRVFCIAHDTHRRPLDSAR